MRAADIFEAGVRLVGAIFVLVNLAQIGTLLVDFTREPVPAYVLLTAPIVGIVLGIILLFAGRAVTRIVYRDKT